MKRNTLILKCFLQFTCTNLDGCKKKWGNFLNLLQKEGVPSEKGGCQRWRKLWLFYGKFATIKKPLFLCPRFILLSVNDSEIEMWTKSLSEFIAKCPGEINCFSIHANLKSWSWKFQYKYLHIHSDTHKNSCHPESNETFFGKIVAGFLGKILCVSFI